VGKGARDGVGGNEEGSARLWFMVVIDDVKCYKRGIVSKEGVASAIEGVWPIGGNSESELL